MPILVLLKRQSHKRYMFVLLFSISIYINTNGTNIIRIITCLVIKNATEQTTAATKSTIFTNLEVLTMGVGFEDKYRFLASYSDWHHSKMNMG
jgi:hypothetical protein